MIRQFYSKAFNRSPKIKKEVYKLFLEGDFVLFKWKNEKGWPITAVTENVSRVFGYEASELIGGIKNYAELIHPDDLEHVEQETKEASRPETEDFIHIPYRIRRSDGSYIWVYESTRIHRNAKEKITNFIGYVIEITSIMEREEQILFLKERFELATLATGDGVWDWDIIKDRVWYSERLK